MVLSRDSMRADVPPDSAYRHLVQFSDYPPFMSGVLSCTLVDSSAVHLVLDIGGQRVDCDVVLADTGPGRDGRWHSTAQVEAFRLRELPGRRSNIIATVDLDQRQAPLHDADPDAPPHARLHLDLTGLRRLCKDAAEPPRDQHRP